MYNTTINLTSPSPPPSCIVRNLHYRRYLFMYTYYMRSASSGLCIFFFFPNTTTLYSGYTDVSAVTGFHWRRDQGYQPVPISQKITPPRPAARTARFFVVITFIINLSTGPSTDNDCRLPAVCIIERCARFKTA